MDLTTRFFFAAAVFAALSLHAQPSPQDAAIRALVQSYLDARQQRNATLLATLFTESVDQLVSSGEWRKGRQALVEGTLASSARETGRRSLDIESIRYLTPDIAIADARYTIAGASDARRMWSTFVVHRQTGQWRIAAIRNMLPSSRP